MQGRRSHGPGKGSVNVGRRVAAIDDGALARHPDVACVPGGGNAIEVSSAAAGPGAQVVPSKKQMSPSLTAQTWVASARPIRRRASWWCRWSGGSRRCHRRRGWCLWCLSLPPPRRGWRPGRIRLRVCWWCRWSGHSRWCRRRRGWCRLPTAQTWVASTAETPERSLVVPLVWALQVVPLKKRMVPPSPTAHTWVASRAETSLSPLGGTAGLEALSLYRCRRG